MAYSLQHSLSSCCLAGTILTVCVCRVHHRAPPAHPWTNGQVERMNRTIKEATVQHDYYQTTDELNQHPQALLLAYNHAKRLKTLHGLTPHEFVCTQW